MIVTTCQDNHLRVFPTITEPEKEDCCASISHRNQTGKWLTKLMALFYKPLGVKMKNNEVNYFYCGSMQEPRQVNVLLLWICSLDVLRCFDSVQEARCEDASILFFTAYFFDPVGGQHASQLPDDCLCKYKWQGRYLSLLCLFYNWMKPTLDSSLFYFMFTIHNLQPDVIEETATLGLGSNATVMLGYDYFPVMSNF